MKEKRWCNEDGKEEKSADKREKTKCKQKKKCHRWKEAVDLNKIYFQLLQKDCFSLVSTYC